MKLDPSTRAARLALGGVCVAGLLVALAYGHDQRLDDAWLALDKARALIEAADGGALNPANQAQLDLLRRKAHQDILAAQATVQQAILLADLP